MAQRVPTAGDVFAEGVDRLKSLYAEGHRIVISFSAGKDSGVILELAIIAATETGRLPVEVVMRDEEIMYPGTYEYAERVASRSDVISFNWLIAGQPIVNVFNRADPFWWVFDDRLSSDQWVRTPPLTAIRIPEKNINGMTIPSRFPPAEGKMLIAVTGIRAQESITRRYSVFAAKGYLTKPNDYGVRLARPIYDWTDGDVWKAVRDGGWDYNSAYDTMYRLGVERSRLRIAPPTLNADAVASLAMAQRAWPQWFERVARRCPGVRLAASFGRRAVSPERRLHETWEATYGRECVDSAPAWIAERARTEEEEEKAQARRDTDVFRVMLAFSNEEAVLVRSVLGDKPAQTMLDMCKAELTQRAQPAG